MSWWEQWVAKHLVLLYLVDTWDGQKILHLCAFWTSSGWNNKMKYIFVGWCSWASSSLNLAFQSLSPIATLFIINYFLPPLCLIFYMPLKCYVLHQPIIPNHPSAKFNRNSSESWPGILFSTRNRRTNCNAIHVIKGQACNHVCLVISSFSCFPKIVVVLLSTKDWTPLL